MRLLRIWLHIAALVGMVTLATACVNAPSAPAAPQPATPVPSQPATPTRARPSAASALPANPISPLAQAKADARTAGWDEFSFDETITVVGEEPQTLKMAVKNGKTRLEVSAMGQTKSFLADPAQNVAYTWGAGQSQAVKMSYDQFEEQSGSRPDPRELSKDAAQGDLVGTDTLDGKPCDVYTIEGTVATLKVWLWKENSFPLRSEMTTVEGTVKTEFKNVKLSGIPDSLFELPAGMQVVGTK